MKNGRADGSSRKRRNGRQGKELGFRDRVAELEQTIGAIRRGDVDALVVNMPDGAERVFLLQGAEHPYRVLVETINEGAATLDRNGTILYANTRFADFVGLPLEKFIGTQLSEHVRPSQQPKLHDLLGSGALGNAKGEIELGYEGHKRLIRLSLSPGKDADSEIICAVATDLTELADASEALKTNEEALRQLSSRLLEIQDEERRRISRDLHDVTGQKLALQCIALSRMTRLVAPIANEETKESIAQCLELTNQISEEIRTLSYLLHPPLLDELGLPSAVKWYTQGFQKRTGIRVDVQIPRDLPRLRPDAEVTLFRVVQESLTNVHRYSGSRTAYVRVSADQDQFKLEVGDFGKGMPVERTRTSTGALAPLGVGIQGMQQRVRQFGGWLDIVSQRGQGTVVTSCLPVRELRLQTESEKPSRDGEVAEAARKPGTKRRILIADDHELMRRGVRSMLENETDLEVCGEAIDGMDAVDKALALNPDLLILDINMPALNGLAAIRQILRVRPEIKILLFTVHESDQTMQEGILAGAHGYLWKGKAGQDLVRAIRAVLGGERFYPNTKVKLAATAAL